MDVIDLSSSTTQKPQPADGTLHGQSIHNLAAFPVRPSSLDETPLKMKSQSNVGDFSSISTSASPAQMPVLTEKTANTPGRANSVADSEKTLATPERSQNVADIAKRMLKDQRRKRNTIESFFIAQTSTNGHTAGKTEAPSTKNHVQAADSVATQDAKKTETAPAAVPIKHPPPEANPSVTKSPRKPSRKPILLDAIIACMMKMKERNGCSVVAIRNFILKDSKEVYGVDQSDKTSVKGFTKKIARELKKGVEKKLLCKVKASFFIEKEVKKSLNKELKRLKNLAIKQANAKTKLLNKKKDKEKVKAKVKGKDVKTKEKLSHAAFNNQLRKPLTAEEKARLKEKIKLEQQLGQLRREKKEREKHLQSLQTCVSPRTLVFSNSEYKFTKDELAIEKFNVLADSSIEEVAESDIQFELSSHQFSKLLMISEFCNFFSNSKCLKLSRFSLEMLAKSLLDTKINCLIREIHFALLDIILEPKNLFFQWNNYEPGSRNHVDEINIYENLYMLNWYSILGTATWQEILRRYLIFSTTYRSENVSSMKRIINVLEVQDYNFLKVSQKLDVLEKLVEEANSSIHVRETIDRSMEAVVDQTKQNYADNKQDKFRKKEIETELKVVLEESGIMLEEKNGKAGKAGKAGKQSKDEMARKSGEVESDGPEKPASKKAKLEKKASGSSLSSLKATLTLRNSNLEEVDFKRECFKKRLQKGKHAQVVKLQKDLKQFKELKVSRAEKLEKVKFDNRIRQEPIGEDFVKNAYYVLQSDLNSFYVCGSKFNFEEHKKKRVRTGLKVLDRGIAEIRKRKSSLAAVKSSSKPDEPAKKEANSEKPSADENVSTENITKEQERKEKKPETSEGNRKNPNSPVSEKTGAQVPVYRDHPIEKQKKWGFFKTKFELERLQGSLDSKAEKEKLLLKELEYCSAHVLSHLSFHDSRTEEIEELEKEVQVLESAAAAKQEDADDVKKEVNGEAEDTEEAEKSDSFAVRPKRACAQVANDRILGRNNSTTNLVSDAQSKKSQKKELEGSKKVQDDTQREEQALIEFQNMLEFQKHPKSYEKYHNKFSFASSAKGLFILDMAVDDYIEYENLDQDVIQVLKENDSLEFEFNPVRLSRNLVNGEHPDYILNWVIAELCALIHLLDRNGGTLNEESLSMILRDDTMLQFVKQNVLGVCDEDGSSNVEDRVSIKAVQKYIDVRSDETAPSMPRKTRNQLKQLREEPKQMEEAKEAEEMHLFKASELVEDVEELYNLSTPEEEEASNALNLLEVSSSMLSKKFCRKLVGYLFLIENLACSIINVKTLDYQFHKDDSSEEEFESEEESEEEEEDEEEVENVSRTKEKAIKREKKVSVQREINPFEELEETLIDFNEHNKEVKFKPVIVPIGRGSRLRTADIISLRYTSFTAPAEVLLSSKSNPDLLMAQFKIQLRPIVEPSRRSEDTSSVASSSTTPSKKNADAVGADSPTELVVQEPNVFASLKQAEVVHITEDELLDGLDQAERKRLKKRLTSVKRRDLERSRKHYNRLWRVGIKRDLWLESVAALYEVTSASAVAVAVAQLSQAIYNPKTKQVFTKKLLKRQYVDLITE